MMHLFRHSMKYMAMMLLFAAVLSSCIYDKYHTVQFSITANAVGDDGKTLPDYLIDSKKIYFFVNERYYDGLVQGPDGSYQVSFPEGAAYTFVAAGSEDDAAFRFMQPVDGDYIHSQYVEVMDYDNLPPLYWGSVTTTDGSTESVRVEMRDIRCRVHVLIRNLRNRFGDGQYAVFIGGLRKGLTFAGEACGDMTEVRRSGAFQGTVDQWLSDELVALPTAQGEGITVRLQRGDGELIAYADRDDDGNVMALPASGDVVFIITMYDRVGISVRVAPWSDVYSEFIF